MSSADPNVVIVTGENPFVRLSATDTDDYTTNASFLRIIFSPAGHVPFSRVNSPTTTDNELVGQLRDLLAKRRSPRPVASARTS